MDFFEAERRFQWLEQQRARGALSPEQYRAEVHKLRVTDRAGRVWMPQELTGQWYVYQNGQWVVAQPPQSAPPSPPQQQQAAARPPSQSPPTGKGSGCGKALLFLILWAVVWTVVAVVVYLIWGQDEPFVLAGVALAAVISLIFLLFKLASHWSGQIVDIRTERVRVSDDEGDWHFENRRYAYVQRNNGKTKKLQARRKWEVGDRLEKRRGEGRIRHYPRT